MLGVDLGTSHTVAMLRQAGGRVRPVLFDGQPVLPSAVYRDVTGRLHVGWDAIRLGYAEPARLEPHPKRHVDAGSVLLGGDDVPVADLLAALLTEVAREVVATAGHLPPAVLTCPASWGPPRRAVLTEALAKAGWPAETELVAEPIAAARYFTGVLRRPVPVGSALAVFDFGGGTLDVAVVRNQSTGPGEHGRFEVAAAGGLDDLGGLDLDAALVEHLGTGLRRDEPEAWAALEEPVTLAQWRARRRFWEDVRGAKEMLSRALAAPVSVPGVEQAVQLSREELELVAAPLVRRGVARAREVIEAAGLEPAELAGLFLVGGSTRVPLVARLLHSELGVAPTVLEQPELPVAEGALPGPPAETAPPAALAENAASAPLAENAASAPPAALAGNAASAPLAENAPSLPAPRVEKQPRLQPTQAHKQPPQTREQAEPTVAIAPPEYADPVDPWATGEAIALAVAHGGTPPVTLPHPGPIPTAAHPGPGENAGPRDGKGSGGGNGPGRGARGVDGAPTPGAVGAARKLPAYRRKGVWIVAAVTVVVLGVAAGLTAWFWPGYPALGYRPLGEPVRFAAPVPVSYFSGAAVRDGRAYFAGGDGDGRLGVVAADVKSGKELWRSEAAGVADRWETFVSTPYAVVAVSGRSSATNDRRMVLLDPGSGRKLWERRLATDDEVLFAGDTAVLVDRTENRLVGLQVRAQGEAGWELKSPQSTYGVSTTTVIAATTEADVAGPAAPIGKAFAAGSDDTRIVQIGADRSARVIDASTGKVVAGPRQSVADPDDALLAHDGRLIVAESGSGSRLVAYDLAKLNEPRVLYTPQDGNAKLSGLTGCGADRVCGIQETGYDASSAQVIAVNAAESGLLWHRGLPDVETLVPVGEALAATVSSSPAQVSLLDADGKVTPTRAGAVGRLDAGNLLLFSKDLSTSAGDPALSGQHLGDAAVPLGALTDVRSATCAWNTTHLACVAGEDFVLQRFAE